MTNEQRQCDRAKAVLSAHDNEIIGQHMPKKKNLDKEPIFFTKINSKWTIDLNVKHKAINLLQENVEADDLEHRNDLTDTIPKLRCMK